MNIFSIYPMRTRSMVKHRERSIFSSVRWVLAYDSLGGLGARTQLGQKINRRPLDWLWSRYRWFDGDILVVK